MLTTYLFKGVLLKRDYTDVIRFQSQLDVLNYLTSNYTYQILTNEIRYDFTRNQVRILKSNYSNVNYIALYDSEIAQYRFYFADGEEITSTNTITLQLKLDVWATFADTITMYNSNIISGHIDEYTNVKSFMCNINGINTTGNNYSRDYILNPKTSATDNVSFSAIVCIIPSNFENVSVFCPYFIVYNTTSIVLMNTFLNYVKNGKTTITIGGVSTTFNYTISNVYLMGDITINGDNGFTCDLYNYDGTQVMFSLASVFGYFVKPIRNIFTTTKTITPLPNKKYHIGVVNDGIDIENENTSFSVKYNIDISCTGQLNIGLYVSNKYIDLTTNYEIPYLNVSNFTQWYYQNKNQLALQNKQQYLQSGIALLGGATSLLMGMSTGNPVAVIGGISATTNAISGVPLNKAQQNARIKDAKASPNRFDNTDFTGLITLTYGTYIDTIDYDNNDELNDDINLNGYMFNIENTPYLPLTSNTYKFYKIKTTNCTLTANTTHDNITELQNIFNNGVRVWYDSTNYLTKINYK